MMKAEKMRFIVRFIVLCTILLVFLLVSAVVIGGYLINKIYAEAKSQDEEVFKGVAKIAIALREYKEDNNEYPINLSLLVPTYLEYIPKIPYTVEADNYPYTTGYYYIPPGQTISNRSEYEIWFHLKAGWLPGRDWWYEDCRYPVENKWAPANISVWCGESDLHTITEYM